MIIFVYNADSGKANAALDMAHKLLSPSTYRCNLCRLTHGILSEKKAWKEFRQSTHEELLFLHRDEFERQFDKLERYPAVLRSSMDSTEVIFTSADLGEIGGIEELIHRVQSIDFKTKKTAENTGD